MLLLLILQFSIYAICLSLAQYRLQEDFGNSELFFDHFTFFTDDDPTNGFVDYIDHPTAKQLGLIDIQNNALYIGVDYASEGGPKGRKSIRLASVNEYRYGLFILDLQHMPGGICGTWPALLVGSNWPDNGEIDIIEGVNEQLSNSMTLHTADYCVIGNTGFAGIIETPNCCVYAANQITNAGCSILNGQEHSYGHSFNMIGGGVYATQWTESSVRIWFFPRYNIPADILKGTPNPASWGRPAAQFSGTCNLTSQLGFQQIVFDTTFCGDWAGSTWKSSDCGLLTDTCEQYVAENPAAFMETYWLVNSLKVYSAESTASSPQPSASGTPTATHRHFRHHHFRRH